MSSRFGKLLIECLRPARPQRRLRSWEHLLVEKGIRPVFTFVRNTIAGGIFIITGYVYLLPPGHVSSGILTTTPGRSILIRPAFSAASISAAAFNSRAVSSFFHMTKVHRTQRPVAGGTGRMVENIDLESERTVAPHAVFENIDVRKHRFRRFGERLYG